MKPLIILVLTLEFAFSQSSFKTIEPFIWELDLKNIIIKSKGNFSKKTINRMLTGFHGTYKEKLNRNSYYKIAIRNNSETFYIYQKIINNLKNNKNLLDIVPIFKVDKFTSDLQFSKSKVTGNSMKVADSLYQNIYLLKSGLLTSIEQEFRNKSRAVFNLSINFKIKNARTVNLNIIDTNIPKKYYEDISRIFKNQDWGNKKFTGHVNFYYLLFREVQK